MQNTTERKDVYSRITGEIVEYLEKGPSLECGTCCRSNHATIASEWQPLWEIHERVN